MDKGYNNNNDNNNTNAITSSYYYYLEGSNDGSTWTSLKVRNLESSIEDACGGRNKGNFVAVFDLSDNIKSFTKYRIRMSVGNYFNGTGWFQMFGELLFEGAKVV